MAALGRVLERHGDTVDGAAVASAWLSALPLVEDRVEARATHAQLVRLVEASDARCVLPALGERGAAGCLMCAVLPACFDMCAVTARPVSVFVACSRL